MDEGFEGFLSLLRSSVLTHKATLGIMRWGTICSCDVMSKIHFYSLHFWSHLFDCLLALLWHLLGFLWRECS